MSMTMELPDIITTQHSNSLTNKHLPHTFSSPDNLIIYQPSPSASLSRLITPNPSYNQSDTITPLTPQFTQLCKSCQIYQQQLIHYQSQIQNMHSQLKSQHTQMQHLQQQINQLKIQQQYLLRTIESMRDKANTEQLTNITISKLDKMLKYKQKQVDDMNKQIDKYKQWVKQLKGEVFQVMECVKIKDIVIQNMEKEIQQYKKHLQPRKKNKKIQNKTNNSNSNQQNLVVDQLTKYKNKSIQLQQQIYQLTVEVDDLRNDNINIKQMLAQQHNKQKKNNKNMNNNSSRNSNKYKYILNEWQHNQQVQEQLNSPIQKLLGLRDKIQNNKLTDSYNKNININSMQYKNSKIYDTCNTSLNKSQDRDRDSRTKQIGKQKQLDSNKYKYEQKQTIQQQVNYNSKQKQKQNQKQDKKYTLLSNKCLCLQQQIQKLINKLQQAKAQNEKLRNSKSLKQRAKLTESIAMEKGIQF